MNTDQTVARTIWAQLGGSAFNAMTGSTDFVGSENFLQFTMRGRLKNKANKCRITLNDNDLYDITFFRYNRKLFDCPIVDSASDIYAEDLQDVFTNHTGLYIRL